MAGNSVGAPDGRTSGSVQYETKVIIGANVIRNTVAERHCWAQSREVGTPTLHQNGGVPEQGATGTLKCHGFHPE